MRDAQRASSILGVSDSLPEKRPDDAGADPVARDRDRRPRRLRGRLPAAQPDQVSVNFVFFTAKTSLLFLILLSMALGAAIAVFGPAFWRRRERLRRLDEQPPLDDQRDRAR